MWRAAVFAVSGIVIVLFGWYQYKVLFRTNILKYKKAVLIAAVIVFTILFHVLMLKKDYSIMMQLNLCSVYTLLCIIGMVDFKTHKIPNKLLLIGVVLRTLFLVAEFFNSPDVFWKEAVSSVIGLAFGLGVMLLLSLITRQGIGYGDVKLFGWLGYALGFMETYNVLFYSILYAAFAGLYLIVVKKCGRKTKIPFAPFIMLGAYSVFIIRFLS